MFVGNTSLDQNLLRGKQQISTLLEKLTLLTADNSQNLYNFGSDCNEGENRNSCIDTEAILKELQSTSRPNIRSPLAFSTNEMQEIYDSLESSKKDNNDTSTNSNSDTSLITNFSDCRPAPDGQGNTSTESILQNDKNQ